MPDLIHDVRTYVASDENATHITNNRVTDSQITAALDLMGAEAPISKVVQLLAVHNPLVMVQEITLVVEYPSDALDTPHEWDWSRPGIHKAEVKSYIRPHVKGE